MSPRRWRTWPPQRRRDHLIKILISRLKGFAENPMHPSSVAVFKLEFYRHDTRSAANGWESFMLRAPNIALFVVSGCLAMLGVLSASPIALLLAAGSVLRQEPAAEEIRQARALLR
ncbi:MAG: hypothetical protein ABSE22_23785 [Xanthobacteraceae bacterium]